MATKDGILTINKNSQDKLLQYIQLAFQANDEAWQLRTRLEEVDRTYMRESDFSEEQRKAQLANRIGDKTKLQNMEVPMVMEDVETAVGFLSNVFLVEHPMFKFGTGDAKLQDLALMWNTLVSTDQQYFGWTGEFNQIFRNTAKYNIAPIEVDWYKKIKYKPVTDATKSGGTKLEQLVYEGNRISSIDPYNLIYDGRVPLHKVHEEGEYVGYVQSMGRIRLKIFLANLGDDRLKNDVSAFQSGDWTVREYIPQINPKVFLKQNNWGGGSFDWAKWAFGPAQDHIRYKNMYTVVTLYARLMPFDFGINAPKDQTPDIWKLIAVNGVMVYAQPMVNAHDLLPIIIASSQVDNLSHQTKSQAENQMPFQEMVNALWNAKLAGARRRQFDRVLYNPLLVDPDHINSSNPAAKIPLRPTAYGRKLDEAVYQFPFHDENGNLFIQEANGVAEWAMRAQGRNRVSMGQFQKGNKLESEFNSVMANAGARDRTQALMLENYAMTPIKIILKSNYLQFAPKGKRYNQVAEKVVDIDPVKLRETEAEFMVGDGLLPIERLANTDVMSNFLQYIGTNPGLAGKYDTAPLISYIMKMQGVDKLEQFEKTPEMAQFEQALGVWQAMAQEVIKKVGTALGDGKYLLPEDVAKIIGPMPQPPQMAQPPQPKPQNNPNANSSPR